MNRYLTEPSFSDPSLGSEARQIVSEASAHMDKWIEDSIKGLEDRMNKELDGAFQQLTAEAKIVESGYQEASEALEKILNDLNNIKVNLGDSDAKLDAQIKDSKATVEAVRKYLQERQDKWKNAGKGIVNTAVSLAKKAVVP